jgi:glucokinase
MITSGVLETPPRQTVRQPALVSAAEALTVLDIIRASVRSAVPEDFVEATVRPSVRAHRAIRTLERRGLIERDGGGERGPSLRLRPRPSGWVLGVDVGGTKVRAGLANAHGEVVTEIVQPTSRGELGRQLASLHHELCGMAGAADARARAACIGIPAVYDADLDQASKADNLPELLQRGPKAMFTEALGMPVHVVQDTRLAAVGEKWRGWARGWDDYVVICIGTGISMGIVVNGEVLGGGRGAAGEIGDLPLGDDLLTRQSRDGRFEDTVSGPGIARRYAMSSPRAADHPVTDSMGVFDAALEGDPIALRHVEHAAALIGLGIAVIGAILDPGLVVLGGGVGSNPALLGLVRDRADRLMARPPQIETSALGGAGSLFGAVAIALDRTRMPLSRTRTSPTPMDVV